MKLLRDPKRVRLYVSALLLAVLVGGFGQIADEMTEGDTASFDNWVLLLFRETGNPADPLGPAWVEEAVRDLTALGGFPILILLVTLTVVYLALSNKWRTAWFVTGAVIGGAIVSTALKAFFDRPRPDIGDVTRVFTASFPSGHATTSAVVYLTLGALLAGSTQYRSLKSFYIASAVALTIIIGMTRLYIGVHYPTDVLAGWMIGTAWALLCWAVYHLWLQPNPAGTVAAPPQAQNT